MILSILVCSLGARHHLLSQLVQELRKQATLEVEILVNTDDGQKPIGTKRNELLRRARGKYVAFVDDDDLVSSDYVRKILSAAQSDPDCCGMEGIITLDGGNPRRFIHSTRYDHWFEKDGVYYRPPNHLSPVKRQIALQVGFPEISFAEDRMYSLKLLPLIESEAFIEGPIYYYRSVTKYLGWIQSRRIPEDLRRLVLASIHLYRRALHMRRLHREMIHSAE